MKTLISVIVPVYNAEKYLDFCIESILSQTNVCFECILVDDGSKDRSGVICDKYAEKYSNVSVVHQANGGELAARATGVSKAKGNYLYFVDSDDSIESNTLECMLSYMTDDVDIVVFESNINRIYTPVEYAKALLDFNHWTVWGKLFRKSLFDSNVTDVSRYFKVGGDFLTNLKTLNNIRKSIVSVSQNKYIYNINNPQSVQLDHQYDYEYEKQMVLAVDGILNSVSFLSDIRHALFNWKMVYLGGMIGLKYNVVYTDDWILSLKEESKTYTLTFKQKVIIQALYGNIIARFMLIMEKKGKLNIRSILKRIRMYV